ELLRHQLGAAPAPQTLELVRLIERSGALPLTRAKPVPIAILRPPRLIGRDAEWARLGASQAAGWVTLVQGEPGIGKTRLLGDYAASAAPGAIFLSARPGDARFPYGLLAKIVRTVASRFGEPTTGWVRDELARVAPEFGTPPTHALDALTFQRAIFEALAQWA